jgi:hypothetical protein
MGNVANFAHRTRAVVFVAATLLLPAANALRPELVAWKLVPDALLKMDEQPVKLWNIYRADKKPQLVLVQLGSRYLLLDTQAKDLFELSPDKFERKGKELRCSLPGESEKPLATSDWIVRSTGRSKLIRVKLTAEGRVLEVHLPQKPDLRSLY